jgi:glucosamine-6-phosphate isomerase
MSRETAHIAVETIKRKPDALLCIAAGHTQKETLAFITEYIHNEKVDIHKMHFINLDEWVGFNKDDIGSCIEFIDKNLFQPLSMTKDQYFFFDGKASDLEDQNMRANMYIDRFGPIDLVVLGVGLNGHLGFNEPGSERSLRTHIQVLDETSTGISRKYFGKTVFVTHGITLGLQDIFAARQIIVQCTGTHKADIVEHFINGAITNNIPASLVRELDSASVFLDTLSAKNIQEEKRGK